MLGVQVLRILAVVYILFYGWILYTQLLIQPLVTAYYTVAIFVVAIILFFAYKYYNKSKGVDISNTFAEIPPEQFYKKDGRLHEPRSVEISGVSVPHFSIRIWR